MLSLYQSWPSWVIVSQVLTNSGLELRLVPVPSLVYMSSALPALWKHSTRHLHAMHRRRSESAPCKQPLSSCSTGSVRQLRCSCCWSCRAQLKGCLKVADLCGHCSACLQGYSAYFGELFMVWLRSKPGIQAWKSRSLGDGNRVLDLVSAALSGSWLASTFPVMLFR